MLVDDEPLILRGMQRALRRGLQGCEVRAFESAEEALRAMAVDPCDLLITDMRMPIMDGATLLERVHEAHPGTIRVVLTGDIDDRTVLRVAPHMHQVLSKPCLPTTLDDIVQRARSMRALLGNEKVRLALGGLAKLPSVPRIYIELQTALADPRASAADIGRVVERDPALCTKLLQLANSTYFGPPRTILRAEEAVSRVGVRILRSLALSLVVFEAARKEALPRWIDVDALQTLALRRLDVARRLSRTNDELYLAATLADVGLLALASAAPETAAQVGQLVEGGMALAAAEREVVGVTHAELGAYLLGIWGLPLAVVEAVAYQNRPGEGAAYDKTLLVMMHVATRAASGAPLDQAAVAATGMLDRALDWDKLARAALATSS